MAMKLINSRPGARVPPVLTSSSLTGAGLMDVWDAVLAHREQLIASGGLERRRAVQQRDWMWQLVDDTLLEALRQSPGVQRGRAGWEDEVMAGEISAVDGAEDILRAFAAHLPKAWVA
jgi:LAO/AO transport system kinase